MAYEWWVSFFKDLMQYKCILIRESPTVKLLKKMSQRTATTCMSWTLLLAFSFCAVFWASESAGAPRRHQKTKRQQEKNRKDMESHQVKRPQEHKSSWEVEVAEGWPPNRQPWLCFERPPQWRGGVWFLLGIPPRGRAKRSERSRRCLASAKKLWRIIRKAPQTYTTHTKYKGVCRYTVYLHFFLKMFEG